MPDRSPRDVLGEALWRHACLDTDVEGYPWKELVERKPNYAEGWRETADLYIALLAEAGYRIVGEKDA